MLKGNEATLSKTSLPASFQAAGDWIPTPGKGYEYATLLEKAAFRLERYPFD